MTERASLIERLETGPGLRLQRLTEAGFLLAALFTGDIRWAYLTLAAIALQVLAPWLAPIALLVALLHRPPRRHAVGDLYFDLAGNRGACAISLMVMGAGLALIHHGPSVAGWLILTLPAASLALAPTVGFCAGCTFYVALRDLFRRAGLFRRSVDGIRDFDVEPIATDRQ